MSKSLTTLELSVTGMTCGSCVKHVSEALQEVSGVWQVDVSLERGLATVTYEASDATLEQLVGAIEAAGYRAAPSR